MQLNTTGKPVNFVPFLFFRTVSVSPTRSFVSYIYPPVCCLSILLVLLSHCCCPCLLCGFCDSLNERELVCVCVCVRLCFFPMWVESNRKNWKKKSNKLEDTRWDRAPGMSHTNRIGSYLFVLLSVSLIAVHVVHAYTLTWHCHAIQTERHTIEKTPKRASLKARRRQSLHHLHTPTEQSNRIQKPPSYRS